MDRDTTSVDVSAPPELAPLTPSERAAATDDILSRINELLLQRSRIDRELLELRQGNHDLLNHECLRCGHLWTGITLSRPDQCPRCHSRHWDRDPIRAGCRTPADPPAPWFHPRYKGERYANARANHRPLVRERPVSSHPSDAEAAAYWERRNKLGAGIPPPPRFTPQMKESEPSLSVVEVERQYVELVSTVGEPNMIEGPKEKIDALKQMYPENPEESRET